MGRRTGATIGALKELRRGGRKRLNAADESPRSRIGDDAVAVRAERAVQDAATGCCRGLPSGTAPRAAAPTRA